MFKWIHKTGGMERMGNVIGCGILLEAMQKLSIFFTLNGNLMGQFSMGNLELNWNQ
jgi:hypothetical protein